MGNQGHSFDEARTAVEYVQAGAIGDVREVHVWTNRPLGYWPQGPVVKVGEAFESGRLRVSMDATGQTGRVVGRSDALIEAVIKTGTRTVVIVADDATHFRPALVRVGAEHGGRSEILEGLSVGQNIVASGQFLIDQARLVATDVKGIVIDSGHWLMEEAPDRTIPPLLAFLDGSGSGTR